MSDSCSWDFAEIRRVEEGLFANRPALKTVTDQSWLWRFAQGYTGRANCLQSRDVNDVENMEERLLVHWRRSRDYGIKPRFRVTPLVSPEIVEFLEKQGFVREGNTLVMVANLEGQEGIAIAPQKAMGLSDKAICTPVSNAQWRSAILGLEEISDKDRSAFLRLLDKLPRTAIGLGLYDANGAPSGAAYASHVGNTGSVFALIVSPARRGQGLGRHMMNYVLNWLKSESVTRVSLQVVADNKPALGLYSSLGFSEMYKYYYLVEEQ